MKTLLWKQYIELRASLVVMIMFGVGLIPVLKYFNSFDSSTLLFLLFCFAGPLLALQIGVMLFKYEFTEGTMNFLDTLPILRQRVWLAKILSGLAMVIVLYLSYILISWFAFNDDVTWLGLIGTDLPKIPLSLLTLAPIFFFSCGVINSMIPVWASTILMLALVWFSFIVVKSHLYFSVNFLLAIPMLTVVMLFAARYAFVSGEVMDSTGRLRRMVTSLVIGLTTVFGIWICLDTLAEKNLINSLSMQRRGKVSQMADGSFIMLVGGESAWYDPINANDISQIVRFDPGSRRRAPIGPRLSNRPILDRTRTRMAFSTSYSWPGIVGLGFAATDRGTKPHSTLMLYDPKVSIDPIGIDHFAFPIAFSKANTLFYGRYKNRRTELVERTSDNKNSVVASFTEEPGQFVYDSNLDLIVAREYRGGKATAIHCGTRKLTQLEGFFSHRGGHAFGNRTAYSFQTASDSYEFFSLDENGVREKLSWVPLDTRLLGSDFAGQPVGVVLVELASGPRRIRHFTLSRFDPEQETITPIIELSGCEDVWGKISPSGKTSFISQWDVTNGNRTFTVDLTASEPILVPIAEKGEFSPLDDENILIDRENSLIKFNWRTNTEEKFL